MRLREFSLVSDCDTILLAATIRAHRALLLSPAPTNRSFLARTSVHTTQRCILDLVTFVHSYPTQTIHSRTSRRSFSPSQSPCSPTSHSTSHGTYPSRYAGPYGERCTSNCETKPHSMLTRSRHVRRLSEDFLPWDRYPASKTITLLQCRPIHGARASGAQATCPRSRRQQSTCKVSFTEK